MAKKQNEINKAREKGKREERLQIFYFWYKLYIFKGRQIYGKHCLMNIIVFVFTERQNDRYQRERKTNKQEDRQRDRQKERQCDLQRDKEVK